MADDKKEISLTVPFRKTISRLFIFRPLWMFILIWVFWVWAIWIGIITFLHFWYMLILGSRHEGLWKRQVRFFIWMTKWNSYFTFYTDKRPGWVE